MDVPGSVLVQRHGFEQNIFSIWLGLSYVDQLEKIVSLFENVRVALLADFAFEFLPIVAGDILAVVFDVSLSFDPIFQALEVNKTYRASALTCKDEGIALIFFAAPAKSALHLFFGAKRTKAKRGSRVSRSNNKCNARHTPGLIDFTHSKSLAVFTVWASFSSWLKSSLGVKFICSHLKSLTLNLTRPSFIASNFFIL